MFMMRLIQFKTQRQAHEWTDERLDGRLRVIVYALAGFVFDRFGKVLVISEIFRTKDERELIYKDDPILRNTVGTHEVWRAIDLRTVAFTPDEIGEMVTFLNGHFGYTGKHATSLYHIVVGYHLHIQVDSDGVTDLRGGPITKAPENGSVD
jgi:hypothetical protein